MTSETTAVETTSAGTSEQSAHGPAFPFLIVDEIEQGLFFGDSIGCLGLAVPPTIPV
jgi:hypothetical protein